MKSKRRTQTERSAATRAALVAAGRRLFGEQGYGAVGTEAIAQAAGVTRGALYHQFADKAELFAAVVEQVEADMATGLAQALATDPRSDLTVDPLAALELGIDIWLTAAGEPEVQRIILLDAPGVLGWERWRATGLRFGLGMVEGSLQAAVDAGTLPPLPVRPLAHLVVSAFDEAALYVAQSPDPESARAEMQAALQGLLSGLATAGGAGGPVQA